jgi:hypothetical protein
LIKAKADGLLMAQVLRAEPAVIMDAPDGE